MRENGYLTTATHITLINAGIYCLLRYIKPTDNDFQLPIVTFSVIIAHSLFGVWKSEIPDCGHTVDISFYYTLYIRDAFALSCIAGQMYIKAGFERILGYAHPIISAFPLLLWIMGSDMRTDIVNSLTNLNIFSCIIYSYLNDQNWWGIGAAILYGTARYSRFGDQNVQSEDFTTCVLVFFTYFAFKACEREIDLS